ncbi:MAG: hypothetical protein A3F33_03105 [Candidatus Woykebacteria bacterium RIFCSPHIGHO2_12_FULL_43_10]|uniref:DUF1761 domain-containing protein n=2 Tax=Candidatus Woykeibacteriota TaxID=1817899 RepID=A0A1G1WXJ3_9BACT|nr:MAG: hypothetical protein A3J50_01305 [Candidatus Woykebacteria bacterium RIFCSPHIGHO2_02_FULL_43_16b]OGY29808.1 MAG: hypothetical protein A3F33_03105 [Candidatus Woykebacteria bacterium RIFCSPHIGHO2_12_FULL_43_10]OGY32482.1 MAG: hypothetical protein A3A61_00830 [Candidatus Woykebacteria bacterium RIFCSPLOWO2_01_FULL_43_14]
METVNVNFWAVVAATISSMILGFVWYSAPVFGKPWMNLIGKSTDELKNGAGLGYSVTFIGALVQAYIMAHFVTYAGAADLVNGAQTGFWAWLGFVVPTFASDTVFSGKSWKLYSIQVGYYLVSLVVMSMILASWR